MEEDTVRTRLHGCTDAAVWAHEYWRRFDGDEERIRLWFAEALAVGRAAGSMTPALRQALEEQDRANADFADAYRQGDRPRMAATSLRLRHAARAIYDAYHQIKEGEHGERTAGAAGD